MVQLHLVLFALFFHATDLVTGIVYACKRHEVCSSKLRNGLFKKCGFLFCYLIAYAIDSYGYLIGFNVGVNLLKGVVSFAVLTELVSIIENICKINPDLKTKKLLQIFNVAHEEEGEKNDL